MELSFELCLKYLYRGYEIAFIIMTAILCLLDPRIESFFVSNLPGIFFFPFLLMFGHKLWTRYKRSDEVDESFSVVWFWIEILVMSLLSIFLIIHYIFRAESTGMIFFIILNVWASFDITSAFPLPKELLRIMFKSLLPFLWMTVSLFFIFYLFALIGYWTYHDNNHSYFSSFGNTLITLVGIFEFDDFGNIIRTYHGLYPSSIIYFFTFLLLISYIYLISINMIIAQIVESSRGGIIID